MTKYISTIKYNSFWEANEMGEKQSGQERESDRIKIADISIHQSNA